MAIIERNRIIRPGSRKERSKYRINLEKVSENDTVQIRITHESKPFSEKHEIKGKDLKGKRNLYFLVEEIDDQVDVIWQGDTIPDKI